MSHFIDFFASFCIGQIVNQQHKGLLIPGETTYPSDRLVLLQSCDGFLNQTLHSGQNWNEENDKEMCQDISSVWAHGNFSNHTL